MARENCNSLQYIEYSQAPSAQCLKIAEKVAFYNVSEASYVYILSGQKFNKNEKNGRIWRLFENLKLVVKQCYQKVENPKKEMRHF